MTSESNIQQLISNRLAFFLCFSCFLIFMGCSPSKDTTINSSSPNITPTTTPGLYNCTAITDNSHSPMGTNMSWLNCYAEPNWRFVDAFIKARPDWQPESPSLCWGQGSITSYDALGWPTGVDGDTKATTDLFPGIEGAYPTGTYVVHWEGNGGTLEADVDGSNMRCDDGNSISNCPGRRALFDVNTTSNLGVLLKIVPDSATTYSSSNYINNIRVIMPGGVCGTSPTNLNKFGYCATSRGGARTCSSGLSCYDFDEVAWDRFNDSFSAIDNPKVAFHPKSMAELKKFGTLRYMEMLMIQDTNVTSWASRTPKEEHTWSGRNGAPPQKLQ